MINAVIDLSHHNGPVDFRAASGDGILGAIHKASQGTGRIDPAYASNRAAATEVGVMWGAYHFGATDDGRGEARHFLDASRPDDSTLLVLDFERNPHGRSMTLRAARAFVTEVRTVTGRWPGLYCGDYLRELLGTEPDTVLGACWLWAARYGDEPMVPRTWARWTMWQYTDGRSGPPPHSVAGIGRCDRDIFNGDEAQLRRLWATGKAVG